MVSRQLGLILFPFDRISPQNEKLDLNVELINFIYLDSQVSVSLAQVCQTQFQCFEFFIESWWNDFWCHDSSSKDNSNANILPGQNISLI